MSPVTATSAALETTHALRGQPAPGERPEAGTSAVDQRQSLSKRGLP